MAEDELMELKEESEVKRELYEKLQKANDTGTDYNESILGTSF